MGKDITQNFSTTYSPTEIEEKWYPIWEKTSSFKPNSTDSESFTIMIPPPNVTGILTMGHVLNNSIQDVLIRRARMQGKNTLWLPGTDHASIATEAKVTKMLKDKGINKQKIGRDEFLKYSLCSLVSSSLALIIIFLLSFFADTIGPELEFS